MSYYQTREPETFSRATSIRSSRSRRSSTISRAQTLIRKNIESHDLRPSDIIIERFIAWKAIVKQLVCTSFTFHPNLPSPFAESYLTRRRSNSLL